MKLVLNFNSIKVRLKLRGEESKRTYLTYFNSIKVRLKPAAHCAPVSFASVFQFHKGTIETLFKPGRFIKFSISIP